MISGWGWRNDCEVPGHFLLLDANPKFNKCGCGSASGSPRLFRFVFMNRSLGISTSSSSNGWTTLLVSCGGMGVSRGRGISILYAYMNAFISEQSMCWVSDHPTSPRSGSCNATCTVSLRRWHLRNSSVTMHSFIHGTIYTGGPVHERYLQGQRGYTGPNLLQSIQSIPTFWHFWNLGKFGASGFGFTRAGVPSLVHKIWMQFCLGRALPVRNLLGEWTFIFRVVLAHDTHLRKLISSSSKSKSLSCGSMFRRDAGIFGKHICGTTGTGKKLSSGTIRCMSQFP